FAGGTAGEVGGDLWRSGKYAYYADKVGPLTLDDRLEASGKVVLKVGAPDSDMFLGWFNSAGKEKSPTEAGHVLGVHVGGPTRDEMIAVAHKGLLLGPSPMLRHTPGGRRGESDGVVLNCWGPFGPALNKVVVVGPAPPLDRIRELAAAFFGPETGGCGIVVEA